MRQVFSSIPGQVLDFMVVLIAVVAIFKTQLTKLVGELFTKLSENAKAI